MLAIESVVGPLSGYLVGLTAERTADLQSILLSSQGIECLTVPVTRRRPVAPDALADQTRLLAASELDAVVFTSGLGVQLWVQLCDVLGIGDMLRGILSRTRLFALGQEARSALAAIEQHAGLVATTNLAAELDVAFPGRELQDLRVAVQTGGATSQAISQSLRVSGVSVCELAVYTAEPTDDVAGATRLFQAVRDGRLNALTFVSPDDVGSFFELARSLEVLGEVSKAMNEGLDLFCLDEDTKGALALQQFPSSRVPQRHGLGEFVHLVSTHLAAATQVVRLGGFTVRLQGNKATIGQDLTVTLTKRERSVLKVLLSRSGVVCSKDALLREVWGAAASDTHAVEVGIARLRRTLGPAGTGIETVVRRGYRIRADGK